MHESNIGAHFIGQLHAVEIEHQTVGPQQTRTKEWIGHQSSDLRGVRIHQTKYKLHIVKNEISKHKKETPAALRSAQKAEINAHLVWLKLLRLRVHAVFTNREKPLDVAVVHLEPAVFTVPLLVNCIDKVAIWDGGYLASVEL